MSTNEQIARLILQQTWEEREAMGSGLFAAMEKSGTAQALGAWAEAALAPGPNPEPSKPAPDPDGWIVNTGTMPENLPERIDIKWRGGHISFGKNSGGWSWCAGGGITHWRPAKGVD